VAASFEMSQHEAASSWLDNFSTEDDTGSSARLAAAASAGDRGPSAGSATGDVRSGAERHRDGVASTSSRSVSYDDAK